MPLHLAAIQGSTEVARILLEHGAELNPPLTTETEVIYPLALHAAITIILYHLTWFTISRATVCTIVVTTCMEVTCLYMQLSCKD